MQTNVRILRARADAIFPPPARTRRQQQCYDRILLVAPALLAEFGLQAASFANLARALRVSAATLRHLFVDLDDLLGEILITHLESLLALVGAIPASAPNAGQRRSQAYEAATRSPSGKPVPAQIILRQAADILPPDLAERVASLVTSLHDAIGIGTPAPQQRRPRPQPPADPRPAFAAQTQCATSPAALLHGLAPPGKMSLHAAMLARAGAGPPG